MQVSGSLHSSCMRCVLHTYQTEGLGAFYRSFSTQLFMNIPFQATHFMVYEFTQERINPDRCYNPGTHIVSGAAAGGVASIVTNPLDVCKTLLNTQKHREDHAIRGLRQAVRTVYETNGIRTFFRGTTARVLYQMPSTAVSWSVYEFFKYLFNNNRARLTADIDIGTRMIVAVPPIVLDEPWGRKRHRDGCSVNNNNFIWKRKVRKSFQWRSHIGLLLRPSSDHILNINYTAFHHLLHSILCTYIPVSKDSKTFGMHYCIKPFQFNTLHIIPTSLDRI